MRALASSGVDVDHQAALVYGQKVDLRDTRPLLYPLRIVTHIGLKDSGNIWRHSPLFMKGRTEPAPQVAGMSMAIPEDLNPSAPPSSTDEQQAPQGARKYEQIGKGASLKLLESILEDVKFPPNAFLVVADWSAGVGDTLMAFVERQKAMHIPMYLSGRCMMRCSVTG